MKVQPQPDDVQVKNHQVAGRKAGDGHEIRDSKSSGTLNSSTSNTAGLLPIEQNVQLDRKSLLGGRIPTVSSTKRAMGIADAIAKGSPRKASDKPAQSAWNEGDGHAADLNYSFRQIRLDKTAIGRQLLKGWSHPEQPLRDMQLLLASVRQQCCLMSARFHISDRSPYEPIAERPPQGMEDFNDRSKRTQLSGEQEDKNNRGNEEVFMSLHRETRKRFSGYEPEKYIIPQAGSIVMPSVGSNDPASSKQHFRSLAPSAKGSTFGTDDINSQFSWDAVEGTTERLNPIPPSQLKNFENAGFSSSNTASYDRKECDDPSALPPTKNAGTYPKVDSYSYLWYVASGILDETSALSVNTAWSHFPGFLHASIPLITFGINYSNGTMPPIDWTPRALAITIFLHLSSFLIGFKVMSDHFGFLLVGISDFRRREYIQRRLSAIISDGYVRIRKPGAVDGSMLDYKVVKIPMDESQNIASWW
ncbi:hypothetical protein HDU67_006805 [Dinochytrium kinnereticum]|nr:hypothetical protein HDU67_006805 [Dinochytrium kinnereticum]